jgi:hypothetical protein
VAVTDKRDFVEPAGSHPTNTRYKRKSPVRGLGFFFCMAHFEGETSNCLFDILEEWDRFLKHYAPFFKEAA